jgi:SAM-dependent methyltransferase
MKADKYYGSAADNYEAGRRHTKRWAAEQECVEAMVTTGPVLDVPIGTGRYVPIYIAKGLKVTGLDISGDMLAITRRRHPDLELHQGSILELPFDNKSFATAVCTRLLDWLLPDQMAAAMRELRRVAHTLVVTIRHGKPGIRVNQTHALADFEDTVSGMIIEGRRLTESTQDGTEEMWRVRQPSWDDVRRAFMWHRNDRTPERAMQRMTDEWIGRLLAQPVPIGKGAVSITCERWSPHHMCEALMGQYRHDSRYLLSDPKPRSETPFPVVLEAPGIDGKPAQIVLDGRTRFNKAIREGTGRDVLVLRPVSP